MVCKDMNQQPLIRLVHSFSSYAIIYSPHFSSHSLVAVLDDMPWLIHLKGIGLAFSGTEERCYFSNSDQIHQLYSER